MEQKVFHERGIFMSTMLAENNLKKILKIKKILMEIVTILVI